MTLPSLLGANVHRCNRPENSHASLGDRWTCPECSAAWSVASVGPIEWRWCK